MAMQTIVQYGAVTILQCLTTRFEQREERDASGADTLLHRFVISVIGYVHAKDTDSAHVGIQPRSSTISQTYEGVSEILHSPRLQFKYRVGCNDTAGGGETVFDIQAADTTGTIRKDRDVDNGPRCTSFNVQSVVANVMWRVEATFEFAIVNCARGGNNDSRVLSNRWSVTDAIDRDRYTVRTYSGRLRMSSGHINPNSFRGLVVPILVPGMRRELMDFRATENGLELAYTIVDKEAAYSAPAPATSWEIVHSERGGISSTPIGIGDISIVMTGDRDVDRQTLISIGLKVMNDRLRHGAQLRGNASHYISDLTVTDYWGSEGPLRIAVQATVVHNAEANAENVERGFLFSQEKIGTSIPANLLAGGYDRHRSRDGRPGERPFVSGPIPLIGAYVTYLQSACQSEHDIGQNQNTNIVSTNPRTGDGPAVTGSIVPSLPDVPPPYVDPSHTSAIYLEYRMESRYSTGLNKIALPVADDPGSRYRSSGDPIDTQKVIRLAPATTFRVMRIRASRVALEPELPQPVETYRDGETVAELMRSIVLPAVPIRTGDGKQLITVEAEYHYALTRPPKSDDAVRIGVAPWDRLGLQKTSQRMLATYSEDSRGGSMQGT